MNLADVNVSFLSLCIPFCETITYTLPTVSKGNCAASSHKEQQSLLQLQLEHIIRSPQLISYSRDKSLMTFYLAKCDKIFSGFHHFLYLILKSCCLC